MQTITTIIYNFICNCSLTANLTVCLVPAYDLIIIEDQDTPLAAKAGSNIDMYGPTAIIVLSVILLGLFIYWMIKRSKYKKRLLELRSKMGDHDKKSAFLIRGIKDEITRLETELVSEYIM